jgi:hypothetical protein
MKQRSGNLTNNERSPQPLLKLPIGYEFMCEDIPANVSSPKVIQVCSCLDGSHPRPEGVTVKNDQVISEV